jgi:3-deoxy-D-manno-octulosonate 8-phosphate phosphatase (KDO 8-P phosphatase)
MINNLFESFSLIKLMVFDMDGVLTNGKISLVGNEEWIREMDIKDGFAIQHALKNGIIIAVITGSFSNPVGSRLQKLGVDLYFQHVKNKGTCLSEIMLSLGLEKKQVLFMGDDIPDLDEFFVDGIKACPADAVQEVKQHANFISTKNGGNGCVREVIEKVMLVQNKWRIKSNSQSI